MFRAFDPEADRLVAVKLFRVDLPPERVHQLVAEFDRLIAAQLTHPAIAAPLAAGIAGAQAYLAAEFVPADSLDIVIRDHGPAPLGHAIAVGAQLAGAIDFAAVVNVGHGAFHPRDVLVSADETRITGFGIAQALARVGVTVPLRRPYAAPERVDETAWGREADLFSLAAICYELLMGRRVAGAGGDAAGGLSPIPGLDIDLARAVFARALAVDPRRRFETALQFVEALKQAVDESAFETAADVRESKRPRVRGDEEPRLPLEEPMPAAEPRIGEPAVADLPMSNRPAPEPSVEIAPVPPPTTFDPADLDLASAETERYRDVEAAPAFVPEPAAAASPSLGFARDQAPLSISPASDEPLVSPPERSRLALWPLALVLVAGLAIGFAAGYGVGTRVSGGPAAPAGRDYTEGTVTPPQAAVTAPPAPAATGAPSAATTAPAPGAPSPGPATATRQPAPVEPAVPPPQETEVEAGRILVRSTPEGARVYIDGRERGRTPLAVRDLATGSHRVRIVHDGYLAQERRVVLSARRPSQSVEVALARTGGREAPARPAGETFVGALVIESRPTGAKVYVDGRLVGTTPIEVPNVPAGSHAVRLEHDGGYRRWTSSVRVVSGERNRVTASLEK